MPDDLLLIPGPTTLSHRVREVLARPQVGHSTPEFIEILKDLLKLTKFVFKAKTGHPFVITGSGSVAMESVVVSLVEPGDHVLALETGAFGKRFSLMLEIHGAKVDSVSFPLGKHTDTKIVDEKLSSGEYKSIFVTHVDTAYTVANPIREVVSLAKKHGVLSVVDSVCGVGGLEFDFDSLGCDVALTASQKALAAPPGAAPIVVSEKALKTMETRKTPIRSYYLDLMRWKKVMDDPGVYLATPATQIMTALREALLIIQEEGLEKRWHRHKTIGEGIRAGLEALDLELLAEDGYRANTVTGLYVSEAKEFQRRLREEFRIHVALGFGDLKEKGLRIGHFGNITASDAMASLSAFETVLRSLKGGVSYGAAAEAALPHFEELIESEGKT